MSGSGTGYPNWFQCPQERQERGLARVMRDPRRVQRHSITLTGRTRPTKQNGKGNPRKSWTTREWTCSCGRTGWSSHIDLEHMEARNADAR